MKLVYQKALKLIYVLYIYLSLLFKVNSADDNSILILLYAYYLSQLRNIK